MENFSPIFVDDSDSDSNSNSKYDDRWCSYVLAEYETGKSSKFHTKRHGPYRVVNKLGPIYSLENLVTNKITDFHVLLLSEYLHDDDNSDIYKVAKIDEEFQEISSVLNHRFK